jgi:hypothetical protein
VVPGSEIVEQGPHDELIAARGFYYSLQMSQFKGKAPAGVEPWRPAPASGKLMGRQTASARTSTSRSSRSPSLSAATSRS